MTSVHSKSRTRQVALGLLAACLLGSIVFATASEGATGGVTPESSAAWLEAELSSSGVGFERDGQTDWGLTVDALIALGVTSDRGAGEQRALDGLIENLDSYVTWDDYGSDFEGVLLAGPVAKANFALSVQGLDPAVSSPRNLHADLLSLMVPTGAEAGRFADRNHISGDLSNMFGQAWGVIALGRSASGAPGESVEFILGQQCDSGAFPLLLDAAGCETESEADTDATALAIQALLSVERTPAVEQSLVDAVIWLLGAVGTEGQVGGTGPTAAPNSNSAALVALALDSAGQGEVGVTVRNWLGGLQVTAENSDGTEIAGETGAVAYSPAALAAAQETGITDLGRDQWRRSTSQALLAASGTPLFHYGVSNPDPIPAVVIGSTTTTAATSSTITSSTVTSSTTTVSPSSTTAPSSTTSTIAPAATSTTVVVTTTAPGAVLGPSSVATNSVASQTQVLSGTLQSSTTSGGSVSGLAITGNSAMDLALMALGICGLGIAVATISRRVGRGSL